MVEMTIQTVTLSVVGGLLGFMFLDIYNWAVMISPRAVHLLSPTEIAS